MAGHLRRGAASVDGRRNAARDRPRNGASNEDFAVNDAALTYRRLRALAGPFLAALAKHPTRNLPDTGLGMRISPPAALMRAVTSGRVQVATEGALWAAIRHHGPMP